MLVYDMRIRVDKPSYYKMVKQFNDEVKSNNLQKVLTMGVVKTDEDIICDTLANSIYIENNSSLFLNERYDDSVYLSFNSFKFKDARTYLYLLYCIECCEKFSYVCINKDNYAEPQTNCNELSYLIEYDISRNENEIVYEFPYDDVEEE